MTIAAQLYTTRQMGDLAAQLQLVADVGYYDVEICGFHERTPAALAAQLTTHGLTACSAHFDWPEFEARMDDIRLLLDMTECRVAVMPWLEPELRPTSQDGWCKAAEQLEFWGKLLVADGVTLAYHNHDFDLHDLGQGQSALDLILAQPHVSWQADIGWVLAEGFDVVGYLSARAKKIISIHAKDCEPDGGEGDARWRDLGEGQMDWPKVLEALQATPCRDLFVEHDDTSDHRKTLTTGRDFLMAQTRGIAA